MTRRRAEPRCLAFVFAAWAALTHAQGGAVVPRIGVMQTWTDNLRLDDRNKDAALITTVSPGIRIASNSGAVRGSLDYSLNGILYVKTDQASRVTNSLAASGQAELIPGSLFVDARAAIGQQSASAFGQQSTPTLGAQGGISNLANANQRETGTLSVSPRLTGALGGLLTYDLRGDFMRTEARGTSLGDSHGNGLSLNLAQGKTTLVSWWLSATTLQVKSSAASNRNSSLRLGLNYQPDPDWRFSANSGQDRSDYLGGGARTTTTSGATAAWSPSNRTRIGADWQHHAYGDSHTFRLEHRMLRSVWTFADTRTTTSGNAGANGGVRTNYDSLYLLYTSTYPDPVVRDAKVREDLQKLGLSPDAPVAGGFLSSGPSRLRNQQLGIMLLGSHGTLSTQFTRAVTSRLGSNVNQGDLASSSYVEQRSLSLTASHQMTPQSGVSLSAIRQETSGDLSSQATRLTSVMANWNIRLGTRTSVQLGGRHSRFEGVTPYTENGAYANLTQSF